MPGQGKSKKRNGSNNGSTTAKPGAAATTAANNNGGKGSKKTKRSGGKSRFTMDIFNEEVMENAYYTCHNIMDVLKCRGFPWPEAQKKKKKKGKK
ncbi:small lysine-rich protein 1 [Microplitis demolitor]|uniref:small lysine-rich protein 1 n=1 Tax=Microplitis demolitor TaxID=69319 RepID=UPI0006D4D93E|nr:small lysine-rich protein 1 [Microplitis demolitor]